ncbi:MAG TPA: peptide ABC transporter substrate-binding protein [Dehalococcoidia bacterium]|nr:peptide ABC transporter substrate-binding protein [Dehalococcoidia bacterium]
MKKIIYLSLALILIFTSFINGCGSSNVSGVLTFTNTDPYTLDPAASNDALSVSYIMQIYSGLLKLDSNLEPVPDIAASMPTVSADGLTYTFHLRTDVKFSDGTPVTAYDFQYSWNRAANPATNSPTAATYLGDIVGVNDVLAGRATEITGVRVIDDHTLQITINSPEPYFLYKLTFPASFVVEKSNVDSGTNWWQTPVGTGPFKVQEWKRGADFILARNNLYYGNKPKIAEIDMILNSATSDMDSFETGKIDLTSPPTEYYDQIMDKSGPFYQDLSVSPSLSVDYIAFNCKEAPFNDTNVRKAFSLAIDKDTIVSLVYRNMAQKEEGILPPGMPGYNSNLVGLDFNVSEAQALIKASSYGSAANLPPITLTIAGEGGSAGPLIQALVYQWKENLGINVQVRELAPDVYYTKLPQEEDQMYYAAWIADYPYPQDFLDILFSTGSSYNYGGYSNAQVDSLIQQANQETDQTKAFALYQQAEQLIVNDAAWLPLTSGENYLLVQPYVENLSINALGFMDFIDVTISPH